MGQNRDENRPFTETPSGTSMWPMGPKSTSPNQICPERVQTRCAHACRVARCDVAGARWSQREEERCRGEERVPLERTRSPHGRPPHCEAKSLLLARCAGLSLIHI